MKKKKLVHITSSLKMGGAEAILCDLVHNLDAFEHHVIYFHEGIHGACLKKLGTSVYQVQGTFFLYDPFFFKRLYTTIKKIDPDCIHTVLWAANNAGRIIGSLLKIPVICALHNNKEQDGIVRNTLDKITMPYCNKLVAVSHQVKDSIHNHIPSIIPAKVTVIPNGIDVKNIQLNNKKDGFCRADLGFTTEHFIIGAVGRFAPVKRFDLLIEAFSLFHKKYPQGRLMLIGVGELENVLRSKIKELGITEYVTFIIGQPSYRYYPLFDCFAQTSDKEGISIALLEAMSFSLPCIVVGDNHHPVIENTINGFTVPPGSIDELMQAFEVLQRDKMLAQTLGTTAFNTVINRFSSSNMYNQYQQLFLEHCK